MKESLVDTYLIVQVKKVCFSPAYQAIYSTIQTSGIFAGQNYDDHTIYGNILCDVKSVW